ncbi:MAG: FAD-dependent oxidoreductase, partial [Clostridia bacterium]|nr:FAD-dependent oxidoreductase [Clostridia bacterium]
WLQLPWSGADGYADHPDFPQHVLLTNATGAFGKPIGEYVLSASEVIHCTRFEDAVARGSYIIDIHDPKGKNAAIGGEIKGMFYEIPYRSLKAVKNKNLHACGRCISVDHIAHSSTRIQGTCILTGQAAGTAAAMAMASAVDVNALRAALIADGVRLD